MNVLTMQDVRKSFGSLEVLKGISLTVGEGEAVLFYSDFPVSSF